MPFIETTIENNKPNKNEIASSIITTEVLTALDNEREDKKILWFNIPLSLTDPDRNICVTFRIDDLLEVIGKAIQRTDN